MTVAHDPILPTTPLTVKVSRTGGFAGLRSSSVSELAPGTAAHDAALAVLAVRPRATSGRPDGLRYEVAIASPRRTLLRQTYSDPLPDPVAALVAGVVSAAEPPARRSAPR